MADVPTAPAVFECAALFADKKSVNGYTYSKKILEEIVADFKQRSSEGIDIVAVVGDKPTDFMLDIDKLRVAAVVSSVYIHEDTLRVSCETIDTTAGHLLAGELRKAQKQGKTSVRVFPIGQLKSVGGNVVKFNLSHFGITAADGVGIQFGDRAKEFNEE